MDEFKVPTLTVKPPGTTEIKKQEKSDKTEKEINENDVNKVQPSQNIECPYKEPKWSDKPNSNFTYKFEVLKSGAIVEEINDLQLKPYWIFGRLPEHNDIAMAHPTVSRFHAVLQYRSKQADEDTPKNEESKFGQGWYIYDLGSTHGTFLNKIKIPPKTYIRVNVGHMIRFGGSTRNYILQGPEFDEEPESELSITELKELRAKQEQEKAKEIEMQENMREKDGIDWGMGEDADEETDLTVNPYASTNNEELFLDDPKKTLRGFFEREGLDLEYKVDEMSAGTFICRVELPIDDSHGRPIVAEVCHKGKKKECVVQCALEACRILDRHGVLRQSHHEPLKRKKPKEDSDEDDDFLDRTGDIERKRLRKMAANQNTALTYNDLIKQENELLEKIAAVEENILRCQEIMKRSKETSENQDDDLDNYMMNLNEDITVDKTEIRKLRIEEQRLKSEHHKIQRLIKIAKPVNLPSLNNNSSTAQDSKKKFSLPLFGKRNKLKMNIVRSETKSKPVEKEMKSDEEEVEEDESEEIPKGTITSDSNSTLSKEQSQSTKRHVSIDHNKQTSSTNETLQDVKSQEVPRRRIGPALIPEEILKTIQKQTQPTNQNEEESTDNKQGEESTSKTSNQDQDMESVQKEKKAKRRIRNRIKGGRENVDIDDSAELEDKDKYSGWLPPENQTGDGMTSLNDKFGY